MILARYLKSAKYVKDAASESERKKFLALIQYFQKYGDKYDVDWLLMAAQGYQESQLNQAARSQVGAIGVMQVMPATGKELGVGDITEVEANIHAGIKYMRWMIDQYYGKEPMTKLDKALFAFASYNAGAGRISQLRKEAAKRGLDPNVWFHNVEYVAAEKIGAETVTYVGNIYKYYIAYRLIMEARAEREEAAREDEEGTGQRGSLGPQPGRRPTYRYLRQPAKFRTAGTAHNPERAAIHLCLPPMAPRVAENPGHPKARSLSFPDPRRGPAARDLCARRVEEPIRRARPGNPDDCRAGSAAPESRVTPAQRH